MAAIWLIDEWEVQTKAENFAHVQSLIKNRSVAQRVDLLQSPDVINKFLLRFFRFHAKF